MANRINIRTGLITSMISGIFFLLLVSCSTQVEPEIITVRGGIMASEMGTTLAHEHIMVDFIGADSTGPHRWNREEVVETALPYLEELKEAGCLTLVECTPEYVGRDPEILRILSEKTGMNILTNTGWYGAFWGKFIPEKEKDMSYEDMAELWIAEFRDGIGNTGIRPGFIKIAVNPPDTLSPLDEKIIRAAAVAHLETGLVIKSHTGRNGPAFAQLRILEEMRVPADAFIWTHAERGTPEGWIMAARSGAWISLDKNRSNNVEEHVEYLVQMKGEGLLGNILLSHDSGWYRVGEEGGGKFRGYTSIFNDLIPALRKAGFSREEIHLLLTENPARAFRIRNF